MLLICLFDFQSVAKGVADHFTQLNILIVDGIKSDGPQLGGIDLIKDDELLGNPSYCPLTERIRAYNQASRAAFEETGKETISRILSYIDRAGEYGKERKEQDEPEADH